MFTTRSTSRDMLAASGTMSILPASIFEKSRMSSMMRRRAWPDSRTIARLAACSSSRRVSERSSSIASTPFMGVRISWLMVARKWLFASFAASASSIARRSPPSISFWVVMSAQWPLQSWEPSGWGEGADTDRTQRRPFSGWWMRKSMSTGFPCAAPKAIDSRNILRSPSWIVSSTACGSRSAASRSTPRTARALLLRNS